jgi:colanic acid/amylovoran biosynthesis glycosyltransferase
VVAHFSGAFFVKSETYIHHYLTHLNTFKPICLARKLENLEEFPFSGPDIYLLQTERGSLKWWFQRVAKATLNRDVRFESILKNRRARVLHAHFGHNGITALPVARKLKIPLVTTFYGDELSEFQINGNPGKEFVKLFDKGNLFLVESELMKKKLHQMGCPLEKILVQRTAIPVKSIGFKERKPKGNKIIRLLFCGGFTRNKGLIYALKAVKRVHDQHRCKNIRFCVIGDGDLKEELDAFVRDNDMTGYVELPGFMKYQRYLEKVEEADIFLHPSVTASDSDSEGHAPTTILEAQAAGLPVISTMHADIPSIVVPDRSALLSRECDVDGLTRNILFLLENQSLWSQMSKTGRRFVEQFHDVSKETLLLEQKYQKLISSFNSG